MSVPKSVVKVKKNGVEYTSNVDACQYYLFELSRAALRDVGKYVKAQFRQKFYTYFTRETGDAGRATSYAVVSYQNTKYPRVEIGLKKSQLKGVYGYEQEFGTSSVPRLGLLRESVEGNIAQIVEIESKYLSGLEDEARALSMINESEYEDDGEE
jgi:hypothetical protein